MQIKKIISLFLVGFVFFEACNAQFVDINNGELIEHSHVSPNLLGGGVGIIDFNADGWEDIYLTGGQNGDVLLINKGDLAFEDVSISSFIYQYTRSYHTYAVSIGDINNDGFEDIFVGTGKGQSPLLFLNSGKGTFENITNPSGISDYTDWNMGALFLDVNADQLQDIYVINYIDEFGSILDENNEVIGFNHTCSANQLFINNGDLSFTEQSNLYNLDSEGCGLAVSTVDINNDDLIDIFVANDFGEWVVPNQLYLNQSPGASYQENALEYNLNDSIYCMGVAISDVNSDNRPDIFMTNIGKQQFKVSNDLSDLYQSSTFSEINALDKIGWGAIFIDYDNDHYEDLYISNGFIGTADFIGGERSNVNTFLKNDVNSFVNLSDDSNFIQNNGAISRGSAVCDLNNDGLMDFINVNIDKIRFTDGSAVNVYINNTGNDHNWSTIILSGEDHSPTIGTKVTIYAEELTTTKTALSGGSHASSPTPRIHFGLEQSNRIDSIKIEWYNRETLVLKEVPINAYIRINESSNSFEVLNCEQLNWGCPVQEEITLNSSSASSETKLFPNPSEGTVYLLNGSPDAKCIIYDLAGNKIATIDPSSLSRKTLRFDLNHLPSGIYYLSHGDYREKFVIR